MFENFGTAIVQAIGFFGIFGFFIFSLLSEKSSSNSLKEISKDKLSKSVNKSNTFKKGLFGKKNKVEQNIEVNKIQNKKGWFRR